MKRCNLTKGFGVFLTVMITLFCGVISTSWAEDNVVPKCKYCAGQGFKGCYGFSHSGIMLEQKVDNNGPVFDEQNPVFTEVPMASVGVFYADGKGNLTGHETVRYGIITFDAKLKGTYEVADDCTGTTWICAAPDNNTLPPIESTISFVITSGGEELQMVTTSMEPCVYVSSTPSPPVPIIEPINIVGIAKKQGCDDDQ